MKQRTGLLMIFVSMILMGSQTLAIDPIPLDRRFLAGTDLPALVYLPGTYTVIEDMMYDPDDSTPAITVVSSEVNIDFNNLSLNHINTNPGVSAINIQPGSLGCNIHDGIIRNFSQSAITTDSNTGAIVLDNLSITGCGKRAIEFNGTVASPINLIKLTGCTVIQSCTTASSDNVVTFSNCASARISECIFSNNGVPFLSGPLALINFTNCSQIGFADNTVANGVGNAEIAALYLNNCSKSLFRDNKVSTIVGVGAASVCRGINLVSNSGSAQNIFRNNIVANLSGAITVEGYFTGTNCNDNYFSNCLSTFNSASNATGAVHGFHSVANSRNKFHECESRAHTAASSTALPYGSYGFTLDSTTRNDVVDCVTTDNSAAGSSVGIYATQISRCHFNGNKSLGHTQGCDFAGTFDDNIWLNNVSSKNDNTTQLNGFPANAVTDLQPSSSVNTITAPWTNVGVV